MYEDRGYSSGPPHTSAVFVGGPIDGELRILEGRPEWWHVAQFPGFAGLFQVDDADAIKPIPPITQTYRVRRDELGYPSITDDGLTRYEYVGSY